MSLSIVGLNLGSKNFRAVEIQQARDKLILEKYGTYKNPLAGTDETPQEAEVEKLSSALDGFFTENSFDRKNVVVSLPENQVFVRTIKVPVMGDKELTSSISFEAEQYIPLPINEVTLSYQKLDPDPTQKEKMDVLLVAAKNSVVSKYVEILKRAHLTPIGLEPETLAICRALGDTAENPQATVIISVSTYNTLLMISYKGFLRLTRSISIGGETLTRAISQKLSLNFDQAEEYKKAYGLDPEHAEGKVSEAITPVFEGILGEIKKSRVFFTSRYSNVKIDKVIVAGGTALMPGLLMYIANNLDIEVELANPWKDLSFSSKFDAAKKDQLSKAGPLYVSPVGLALKEL